MRIEFDGKNNQSFEWWGSYRGIRWSMRARKSYREHLRDFDWCHYIHLSLEQLPESVRESFWLAPKQEELPSSKRKYVSYDYYNSPLGGLEWHGGITFYEKRGGIDGEPRFIQAGCDYMHLWDEDKSYDFNDVFYEVKETIDSLHKQVPGIGMHCGHGYCGRPYHLETEGIYHGEDKTSFICFYCEGKRQKELSERESKMPEAKPTGY